MELEGLQAFRVTLERFQGEVKEKTIAVKKKIGFGIFRRAVKKSPVDTGYFRLGWNLSAGTPDRSLPAVDGTDAKQFGAPDLGAAMGRLSKLGINDDVYICNVVEYGIYLEGGSSKQAPSGVLGLSVLEELEAFRKAGMLGVQSFFAGAV